MRSEVFTSEELETDEREPERLQFCTVVSLALFEIRENRTYGIYHIPAAPWPTDENPTPFTLYRVTDKFDMIDQPLDNRREPRLVRCRDIARDIISAYRNHGVFIAKGLGPTKQELQSADATRTAYFDTKIQEADGWWESMQPLNRLQISDDHRRAAKFRKVDRAWMFPVRQGRTISCPGCGEDVREGIAICPHCRSILDPKKAKALGHTVHIEEPEEKVLSGAKKG